MSWANLLSKLDMDNSGQKQRKYWINVMLKIADPVLNSLSKHNLKKNMPLHFHPNRSIFAPLEAFGRLSCGIAPWLELEKLSGEEEILRYKYLSLFIESLDAATDPKSPDYMNFDQYNQPLVDTAFLSHALVRAPKNIVSKLDSKIKNYLINALKKVRNITPCNNNWILFSSMVEAGLYVLGSDYDIERISNSVNQFMNWYKGDGIYGDGTILHCDYYNSFVIQPMLIDLVSNQNLHDISKHFTGIKTVVMERAKRYATILERLISPEGYYPLVGRSLTYRFGAFQLLSQSAMQHFLGDSINPAQIRCALTAVIKNTIHSGIFDKNGWLVPGVYSEQPNLTESYINIGSLYLCATVFLTLGLPPSDPFWNSQNEKWTSQKIVAGENIKADSAIKG